MARGTDFTLIPAELKSAAKGGFVTSTEQIRDNNLGINQEEINQFIYTQLQVTSGKTTCWFTGTDLTGEETVTFNVPGAKIGDFYLNISTYGIYKATSSSNWIYLGNIKGDKGLTASIEVNGETYTTNNNGKITLPDYPDETSINVNGETYTIDNSGKITLPDYPDEVAWGNIKGSLNDQTDLKEILNSTIMGDIATVDTCMGIIDELI